MRPHKDSRGITIEEDCLVAYNRSGDVVLGRVLDASSPGHIKVTPVDQGHYYRSKFSRVKRGHSMLVLTEPGGSIPIPVLNDLLYP